MCSLNDNSRNCIFPFLSILKLHFSNTTTTKLTYRTITHLSFLASFVVKNVSGASSKLLMYKTQPDRPHTGHKPCSERQMNVIFKFVRRNLLRNDL